MAIGISLHIGLNKIDPATHEGDDGRLNSPEYDATQMCSLAESLRYSARPLYTMDATRGNIFEEIKSAARRLRDGDIFFITFSGHGCQFEDRGGDVDEKDDHYDEAWVTYDDVIVDDELHYHWSLFKHGVRILVVSDSCNSGTVSSLRSKKGRNFKSNSYEVKASVKLLAASEDSEFAKDGNFKSLFTKVLLDVWNFGGFRGNYSAFYSEIAARFRNGSTQHPAYFNTGTINKVFDNQKPFTI